MGASLALAGMTACTKQPLEPIVPYVKQPEELIPGRPMFYATAMTLGGYGSPLLVESHLGRPTKIEGNPEHPASLGGTDIFSQASILDLYDPDRSQTITYLGDVHSWGAFLQALRVPLNVAESAAGSGYPGADADQFISDARRPVPPISEDVTRGEVARVRTSQPGQRPCRRADGLRSAGGNAIQAGECRRDPLAGR